MTDRAICGARLTSAEPPAAGRHRRQRARRQPSPPSVSCPDDNDSSWSVSRRLPACRRPIVVASAAPLTARRPVRRHAAAGLCLSRAVFTTIGAATRCLDAAAPARRCEPPPPPRHAPPRHTPPAGAPAGDIGGCRGRHLSGSLFIGMRQSPQPPPGGRRPSYLAFSPSFPAPRWPHPRCPPAAAPYRKKGGKAPQRARSAAAATILSAAVAQFQINKRSKGHPRCLPPSYALRTAACTPADSPAASVAAQQARGCRHGGGWRERRGRAGADGEREQDEPDLGERVRDVHTRGPLPRRPSYPAVPRVRTVACSRGLTALVRAAGGREARGRERERKREKESKGEREGKGREQDGGFRHTSRFLSRFLSLSLSLPLRRPPRLCVHTRAHTCTHTHT